jgi:hypothetical protein
VNPDLKHNVLCLGRCCQFAREPSPHDAGDSHVEVNDIYSVLSRCTSLFSPSNYVEPSNLLNTQAFTVQKQQVGTRLFSLWHFKKTENAEDY